MNKQKRKRKFIKINLYETSAVGIPSYPDAHFSLIKAISDNIISYSNTERRCKQMEEIAKKENCEAIAKANTSEQKESVEKKVQETAFNEEKLLALISKAVEEALEKNAKRGLVEKEKNATEDLTKLSVGELAIKAGLYTK